MGCKITPENVVAFAYGKYRDELLRYFYISLRSMDDAEDMLHNLFLKLMRIELVVDKSIRSLLFTMAKRMVIDYFRHKNFIRYVEKQMYDDMMLYDEDSIVRKVEASDILSLEHKYLAKMPVKRATIYQMYKHDGFSVGDIAQRLQLSKRTVESQIYTSTKEIKSYLKHIV